jgi:hypothetical protein
VSNESSSDSAGGLVVLAFFALVGFGVWSLSTGGVDSIITHKDTTTYIEGNWWVGEHRSCFGNIAGVTDNTTLGCASLSGRSGDWTSFPIHVLPVEYHGSVDRKEELIQWDCQRKEDSLVCKDKNPTPEPAKPTEPTTDPTAEDIAFAEGHPAYMTAVKEKLTQNWDSKDVDPSVPAGTKAKISFRIGEMGNPGHPSIQTSSGYPSLDQACLNTEGRVLSFDPPSSLGSGAVNVSFTCVAGQ